MRPRLVAAGLVLALWPLAGLAAAAVFPSLLGFFASRTVVVAYVSMGVGLTLLLAGLVSQAAPTHV